MRHGPVSFREAFVRPLLEGRTALVGAPLRPRDLDRLAAEAATVFDGRVATLLEARLRRYAAFGPAGVPGPDEILILAGLHDFLVLAHPERGRVWARPTRWTDLAALARRRFEAGAGGLGADPLRVHVLVEPVLGARLGGRAPRRPRIWRRRPQRPALRAAGLPVEAADRPRPGPTVASAPLPPLAKALRTAIVSGSPWTALLEPDALGDAPFPLEAIGALEARPMWRTVCHRWSEGDRWIERGGRIMERLGRSLRRDFAATPAARRGAGWILAALVHVHVLRVWAGEARLATAVDLAAPAVQHFLALPLALPRLAGILGDPLAGASPRVRHLWDVHLERLHQVVLRDVRREMVDAVVDPVVERT